MSFFLGSVHLIELEAISMTSELPTRWWPQEKGSWPVFLE